MSKKFECALCLCIQQSKNNPPAYVAPIHMCGTWARSMWDCANVKVYRCKKFGECFPCKSKM